MARLGRVGGKGKGKGKYVVVHHYDRNDDSDDEASGSGRDEEEANDDDVPAGGDRYPSEEREAPGGAVAAGGGDAAEAPRESDAEGEAGAVAPGEVKKRKREWIGEALTFDGKDRRWLVDFASFPVAPVADRACAQSEG